MLVEDEYIIPVVSLVLANEVSAEGTLICMLRVRYTEVGA